MQCKKKKFKLRYCMHLLPPCYQTVISEIDASDCWWSADFSLCVHVCHKRFTAIIWENVQVLLTQQQLESWFLHFKPGLSESSTLNVDLSHHQPPSSLLPSLCWWVFLVRPLAGNWFGLISPVWDFYTGFQCVLELILSFFFLKFLKKLYGSFICSRL